MTGTEIKGLAESFLDDEDVEVTDALNWINDCLNTMGIKAKVYGSTSIAVSSTTSWYALPSDLIQVEALEDSSGNPVAPYVIRNGKIRCSTTGTFSLFYRRLPATLQSLDSAPDVHPFLHRAIASYLAGKYKMKDGSNSSGARFLLDYQMALEELDGQINAYQQDGSFVIEVV